MNSTHPIAAPSTVRVATTATRENVLDGNAVRFGFLGSFALALLLIDPPIDAAVNSVGWWVEFRFLVGMLGVLGVGYVWLRMIAAARGPQA